MESLDETKEERVWKSADVMEKAFNYHSIIMCPTKTKVADSQISPTSSTTSLDSSDVNEDVMRTSLTSDEGQQDQEHFFEGVEKLLEVWFTGEEGNMSGDVRKIPRHELERMLCIVKCEIISATHNDQIDSYVLSESSMFVSQRRLILKTCGTTTPLECIQELLRLVKKYTGFTTIEDIFYSRKNFARPELQSKPHRSFEQEVAMLDGMFNHGVAYTMGTVNKDCWHFYTLNPIDRYVTGNVDLEPDQTIEILMTELDPQIMKIFTQEVSRNGLEATKTSGIDKIIPNMKVDDFLFQPCGYSMNGILKNEAVDNGLGEYMTIHITPEPEFSYVSFETNVPMTSYLKLIHRVLDMFMPGKFILTIYANRTSISADCHKELQMSRNFGKWIRSDIQYCSLQNNELTYAHFVRFPS